MRYQSQRHNVVFADPENVTIVGVQANDKGATVSWTTKSQEDCSGAVTNYTIFYGSQEGPALSKAVTEGVLKRFISFFTMHL